MTKDKASRTEYRYDKARKNDAKLKMQHEDMATTGRISNDNNDNKRNNVVKTPYHRRPSPIARMRDVSIQRAASISVADERGRSNSETGTATTRRTGRTTSKSRSKCKSKQLKSDRETKKGKSRKWKKKMKIAQERKRQERRALDDDHTIMSTRGFVGEIPVISCVMENVVGSTSIFKRITQCAGVAAVDGVASEYEEYSDSSVGVSDYESSIDTTSRSEYESSVGTGTIEKFYSCYDDHDGDEKVNKDERRSTLNSRVSRWDVKSKQQLQKPRRRLQKMKQKKLYGESSSSVDESSISRSVDTTVLEEMSASFVSTGETTSEYTDMKERTGTMAMLLQSQHDSSVKTKSLSEASIASTLSTSGLTRNNDSSSRTDHAFITAVQSLDLSSSNHKNDNTNITTNGGNKSKNQIVSTLSGSSSSATNRILSTNNSGACTKLSATTAQSSSSPSNSGDVKNFIESIIREGESMLWHQETTSSSSAMGAATSNVVVRLKQGYMLPDGNYCAPRLIWTDRKTEQNYGSDIFDIQSLNRADVLRLENFPYAIPGRSVCLRLKNTTNFIFEARNEEKALRFVKGIRSIVARLAYDLVAGIDVDAGCELLELVLIDASTDRSPRSSSLSSSLAGSNWNRAMDDVTEQMIEKTLQSTMI